MAKNWGHIFDNLKALISRKAQKNAKAIPGQHLDPADNPERPHRHVHLGLGRGRIGPKTRGDYRTKYDTEARLRRIEQIRQGQKERKRHQAAATIRLDYQRHRAAQKRLQGSVWYRRWTQPVKGDDKGLTAKDLARDHETEGLNFKGFPFKDPAQDIPGDHSTPEKYEAARPPNLLHPEAWAGPGRAPGGEL